MQIRRRRFRFLVLAAVVVSIAPARSVADQTVQVGPGMVFSPATVTIAPGEAVIWNFNELHTSTSDATTGPEVWDSGSLSSGTFSHTFQTPGNHPYYCQIHSFPGGTSMNGVVIVAGGATPTATLTGIPPTATLTPSPTPTGIPPTATATPSLPSPSTTPTAPPTATATVTSVPSGPTATPPAVAGVPVLDARGRLALALGLALAGSAMLFRALRH